MAELTPTETFRLIADRRLPHATALTQDGAPCWSLTTILCCFNLAIEDVLPYLPRHQDIEHGLPDPATAYAARANAIHHAKEPPNGQVLDDLSETNYAARRR